MKTILLEDGTVGKTDEDVNVGDTVTVSLHDENGMPIEATGVVKDILVEDE